VPPQLLTLDEVLAIHRDQIERYGGRDGIRDIALLSSAVAMPGAGFGEVAFHVDLFEMAAAYLFHIARNHPFVDGNKRTGLAAALVFLDLNGVRITAADEDLETLTMGVAEGRIAKAAAAVHLREAADK
jgi:death-on-curing protein